MSRDVEFSSVEAFLADLDEDADLIADVVRVEIVTQKVNEGVSDVFVRAGFVVDSSRRQLVLHCGEEWKPSGGGGREQAEKVVSDLTKRVKERSIEVRAGGFV